MTVALTVLGAFLLVLGTVAVLRLLFLVEGQSFVGVFRCFFRGLCNPVKHHLGGFRCAECGTSGTDMGQFPGHEGAGYVPPVRRTFDRRHSEWTRTVAWERGARGKW